MPLRSRRASSASSSLNETLGVEDHEGLSTSWGPTARFLPSGDGFVHGAPGGVVRVRSIDGKLLWEGEGRAGRIVSIDHSLTGNRVLAVFRDGAARLDLVPVDFVTEAAMRLLRDPRAAGRTYHLTAGRGHTVPVRRLIETAIGIAGDGAPGNLRFLGAGAPAPRRWRRMESFFAYPEDPLRAPRHHGRSIPGALGHRPLLALLHCFTAFDRSQHPVAALITDRAAMTAVSVRSTLSPRPASWYPASRS